MTLDITLVPSLCDSYIIKAHCRLSKPMGECSHMLSKVPISLMTWLHRPPNLLLFWEDLVYASDDLMYKCAYGQQCNTMYEINKDNLQLVGWFYLASVGSKQCRLLYTPIFSQRKTNNPSSWVLNKFMPRATDQ